MARKTQKAVKDFEHVKLVKKPKPGAKPMPASDPVFLDILRKAVRNG